MKKLKKIILGLIVSALILMPMSNSCAADSINNSGGGSISNPLWKLVAGSLLPANSSWTITASIISAGLTMSGDIVMDDNSVTGIDTLTFTDTAGTIAGIENQNLVDKTATESISGTWSFTTAFPETPSAAPTTNYQVANKKYVDDTAAGTGTVTSVAISGADGVEIDSGSPITTSGTIALGINKTTLLSHINVEDGADITDATNIASSIVGVDSKTTPVDADTIPLIDSEASNVLKELTWSNLKATLKTYFDTIYSPVLTFGIADTNAVKIDGATVADNDYAKFTTTGLEGRSYSEVKTDLSLGNVENTALSTWAGTSNITTLGGITTGSWATNLLIGAGAAGVDYTITMDGETNDGVLQWLEDENAFYFQNSKLWTTKPFEIAVNNSGSSNRAKIYFSDTNDIKFYTGSGSQALIIDTNQDVEFTDYAGFDMQTITYNGTETVVNWGSGNKATLTFGAGDITTLSFTNPTYEGSVQLIIKQDDVGGRVVTNWDTDIKWAGGTEPTLSDDADAVDILSCLWNGTAYYCSMSLDFS